MHAAAHARETRYVYGFDRIAPRQGDPVLLVYGLDAYEAAERISYGRYVERVAIPQGCGPLNDDSLTPYFRCLKSRAVVIWPEPGADGRANAHRHAAMIAEAGAASVGVVTPRSQTDADENWFEHFELGDKLPGGATPADIAVLINAAFAAAKARALPVRSAEHPRATRAVPPASDPVEGAALFARLRKFLGNTLAEPQTTIDTVALWCLHAWMHDAFDVSPRLILHGNDPRAEHARALRLIAWLTPAPLVVSRTIATYLLPTIAAERPTLLLDDVGGTMLAYVDMRALIAAGAARDGAFLGPRTRRSPSGWLSCFTPTALATCARLPDNIRTRAIVIPMSPPAPGAASAMQPLGQPPTDVLALRADMQRWANDVQPLPPISDAATPQRLSRVARENCRPLFTIAQAVGEETTHAAATAVEALAPAAEPTSSHLDLLRDIRDLMRVTPGARIPSADILAKLTADAERAWSTAMHGRKLNANGLAERLKRFAVRPRLLRMDDGTVIRGYDGDELVDAFARYLNDNHAVHSMDIEDVKQAS